MSGAHDWALTRNQIRHPQSEIRNSPMPWYLYLALRQLFPTGRRLPFFTLIAVISVALGVALLIVVLGVMGGFQNGIRQMTVDTQGEVQVRAGSVIHDAAELQQRLATVPGVAATTPFAEGVAVIRYQNRPGFPAIQGVDLERVNQVVPLDRFIFEGKLEDLDDDSIILSEQLAAGIGARVGSKIEIFSPLLLENLGGEDIILPRELRIAGIFRIGHNHLDSSLAIVTLRLMQELYGLGDSVHGINIKLAPGLDADQMAARINEQLPPSVQARSWYEINAGFLWVIQMEKNVMTFIMLFVVLVAAFLTMSLLLVLVLKKTREIGLLGALGAERRDIALCFCLQGVGIGVVGTLLGLGLGFTFLYFRNEMVTLITRFTGSRAILSKFYHFDSLPTHTDRGDLILIVISAILLSTLAGLVPAMIAARMKPVEALRSE